MVHWKPLTCFLPTGLTPCALHWLLYMGSFTEKLKRLGQQVERPFRIEVLQEKLLMSGSLSSESQLFDYRYFYIREVNLYLGMTLVMYAKSVVPQNAPVRYKRQFRGLGKQPLGPLLFNSLAISRSEFKIAKFFDTDECYQVVTQRTPSPKPKEVWGRRSIFSSTRPLLMLTEIFSPDFFSLLEGINDANI